MASVGWNTQGYKQSIIKKDISAGSAAQPWDVWAGWKNLPKIGAGGFNDNSSNKGMAVQCLTGGKDQIKCVDYGMHKAWGEWSTIFKQFSECSEYVGHYKTFKKSLKTHLF